MYNIAERQFGNIWTKIISPQFIFAIAITQAFEVADTSTPA